VKLLTQNPSTRFAAASTRSREQPKNVPVKNPPPASFSFFIGLALLTLVVWPDNARATIRPVTSLNDDGGVNTLRGLIGASGNGDTINFSVAGTITLTNGELSIIHSLTFIGPGPASLTISGNNTSRVFDIGAGTTNSISDLRIANSTDYNGGGILNEGVLTVNNCTLSANAVRDHGGGIDNFGTLQLNNCTISGNRTGAYGGGIYNVGTLTANNCTISGNASGFNDGGGIYNVGTLTANNCTVSGNTASLDGGGIYQAGGMILHNTLIAGNTRFSGSQDVKGPVTSQGHNLIGNTNGSSGWVGSDLLSVNPLLGLLQDNGGPTFTMALSGNPISAAIDAGDDLVIDYPDFISTDQRGYPRKRGAHVDIGAYEVYAPETIFVTNTNDSGSGSLRRAIQDATSFGGDSVAFAGNVTGSIVLTSGELQIDKYLNIIGPTATALTISGNHSTRVFHISVGYYADPIKLSNLTIANGNTAGPGAGIFNETGTALLLNNCTISGNTSGDSGGGIANNGLIALTNCTVSGNHAVAGGGLDNYCGTLNLWCCTVASNSASTCGGFYNYPTVCSYAQISGTLIADNTSSTGPDILGSFTSAGYNLIGKTNGLTDGLGGVNQLGSIASPLDPKIGPLQNNGGPTFTHALLAGSPAINSGNSFGVTADQRGNLRPLCDAIVSGGDGSDIGAYEYQICPTNLTVVNTNDGGAGSLRQAIVDVESGGLIRFASNVTGMITLSSGELLLNKNLNIYGPGATTLAISGNSASRVFDITNVIVNIAGVTIRDGVISGGFVGTGQDHSGAGILNYGLLGLTGCEILNNSVTGGRGASNSGRGGNGEGAGIANFNTLSLNNCYVHDNTANGGGGGTGSGNGGNGYGGGIYNISNLTVTASTISSNTVAGGGHGSGTGFGINGTSFGGGIASFSGVVSNNTSTIAHNTAHGYGGGVVNYSPATFVAVGCTISGNAANLDSNGSGGIGGGIYRNSGVGNLADTIVAANTAVTSSPDLAGSFTTSGYNLIGISDGSSGFVNGSSHDFVGTQASPYAPVLGALADNGGTTPTMALLTGSPAIDQGHSPGLLTDQRGRSRTFDFASIVNATGGDGSDIGAFELNLPILNMARTANNVVLSWLASDTGYTLQFKTNITPSVTWSNVSGAPVIIGDLNFVTNSAAGGKKFYRLAK